jgi:hypothetical protein
MEAIGLLRDYDLKSTTDIVKKLAGIQIGDLHG